MKENPSLPQVNERIAELENEIRRLQSELAVLRAQELVEALLKADGPMPRENHTVLRTQLGLTIKGTRLTLYQVMDEIREGNSLKNARDIFELTDEEMLDILDYIHLHKEDVEKEYREILRAAEDNQKYWEEKNREYFEKRYPQRELNLAKLREWREKYHHEF